MCCDADCNGCTDRGVLTGGTITVGTNPVCVGDAITFTAIDVLDRRGGSRLENCAEVTIPPVPPTYTWVITKPDTTTVTGPGPIATVVVDLSGTYSVIFTVTAQRDCPPGPITLGPVTGVAMGPELGGDANHGGAITDADTPVKDTLPGVIVLCNADDDNGDGVRDIDGTNAATVDDGGVSPDSADLGQVILRAMPDLPMSGATVTLTLHTATNVAAGVGPDQVVRIFAENDTGTGFVPVLGPTATSLPLVESDPLHRLDLEALRAGDVTLWVEGLKFAGEVKLKVDVVLDLADPNSICSDQIQLKVAPYIMLPNTATASRVLVADDDTAFRDVITALAGGPGNVITTTAGDQWPQDAWEFGFSSTPFQTATVSFETLRAGLPLQDWGRVNMLGPTPTDPNRAGLIYRQTEVSDNLAYGGNLEVTPALSNEPLGRIVVGTMPQVQKDFLIRQGVQTPLIELDTSWLTVGHIDEFLSFVPAPATGGWDVVWASPNQAMALLFDAEPHEPLFYCDVNDVVITGQATGGTSDTLIDTTANFIGEPFFQYVRIYEGTGRGQIAAVNPTGTTPTSIRVKDVWLFDAMVDYWDAVTQGVGTAPAASWFTTPDSTSKYVLVPCSKMWIGIDSVSGLVEEFPALVTAGEVLGDADCVTFNVVPSQTAIDVAESTGTIPFWPVTESVTFVDIPALYMGDSRTIGGRWALALVPGMVNMQVWKNPLETSLWLPKPYGPRGTVASVRFDRFESAADQMLPIGRRTEYIDNWNTYHRWMGEVHCGTNVIRVVPAAVNNWWETQP